MNTALSKSRLDALDRTDHLPSGLRQCVHEFGMPIVSVLMKHGVKNPAHVREIVRECWWGAREGGQTSGYMSALDFLLARGPVNSKTLMRILNDSGMVIVPTTPTRAMINASVAEVSNHDLICTKEEKHRLRLMAAIKAAAAENIR